MNRIDENIRKAFALARAVAREPDRFPDRFIALPLDSPTVQRLLSTERVRLLRTVRDHGGFESVSKLAAAVRRDQGVVSRDVGLLEEAGLVVVERHGKLKSVRATERPIVLA